MQKYVAMFTLALALGLASTAKAGEGKIVVLALEDRGIGPQMAATLTDIAVVEVERSGRFAEVVGQFEIGAMLTLELAKDSFGCNNLTCASEIGGAIDADYALAGSVGELGSTLTASLTLMDVRAMTILKRVFTEANVSDGVVAIVRRAVTEALDTKAPVVDEPPVIATPAADTLQPEGCATIVVDYDLAPAGMAKGFEFFNPDIKAGSFRATPRIKGKTKREVCWFRFDPGITSAWAKQQIEASGDFLVADLWELNALGQTLPDLQRKFPMIVALGSVWHRMSGYPYVQFVSLRRLDVVRLDSSWDSSYRFLAVRK